MLTIHVGGLVYFHACENVDPKEKHDCDIKGKRAFAPNGTKADLGLPPHFASFWVDADRYESDQWWPGSKFAHTLEVTERNGTINNLFLLEFQLPEPAQIEFPDSEDAAAVVEDLGRSLPRLQDRGFELADNPDAIATIPIRGGTLEGRSFGEGAMVQWTIAKHPETIQIKAKTKSGEKTLTLRNVDPAARKRSKALEELGVEVVFINAPNLVSPAQCAECERIDHHGSGGHAVHDVGGEREHGGHDGPRHSHASHRLLYGKLDKSNGRNLVDDNLSGRVASLFEDPFEDRANLDFNHGFLRYLLARNEVPDGDCEPNCC